MRREVSEVSREGVGVSEVRREVVGGVSEVRREGVGVNEVRREVVGGVSEVRREVGWVR